MADPKPTIRVEGVCRADGRCPECGGLYDSTLMHSHDLPCGCVAVGMSCAERHLRALLTEALRQHQMDREFLGFPGEDGVKPARAEYAPEMDTMETLAYVETCAAAWEPRVRLLGNAQAGDIVAACLAVKALLEERDAAIRERQALDLCTVCAGTGKPVSGKPCICGGHGGIGNQIIGLTRAVLAADALADEVAVLVRRRVLDSRSPAADALLDYREPPSSPRADRIAVLEESAEKAEALLRECERFIAEHSTTWRSGRRLRDAMLTRIREALPK